MALLLSLRELTTNERMSSISQIAIYFLSSFTQHHLNTKMNSWFYRMRPSVAHDGFSPYPQNPNVGTILHFDFTLFVFLTDFTDTLIAGV